jgi:hypothetical protein
VRIKLSELEEARRNPQRFAERLRHGGGGGGKSKVRTLQEAIYEYHRRDENLAAADEYLVHQFTSQFPKAPELPHLRVQLGDYVNALQAIGHTSVQWRVSLALRPSEDLVLGGEVARIDMTADGYAAYVFARSPHDWRSELRMPVVLAFVAREMQCAIEELRVGIYDLNAGAHEDMALTVAQVDAALQEVVALGAQIAGLLDAGE